MCEALFGAKYEIITELGNHHNVWLLLDRETEKVYVGKCLEVYNWNVYEALTEVHNVHIPFMKEYFRTDDMLCVIEEYVNGESLEQKLERGELFSEEEAIPLLIQLCDALECLHSQKIPIIHRDIKPSNVMLTNDGTVKLIDYNAARHYETGVSKDTALIGTAGYAAPEQYGFAQTDVRTDIYALGILMNFMVTGAHMSERVCMGPLKKIVKKCTYIDPDKRYSSVSEIRRELEKIPKTRKRNNTRTAREEKKTSLWPIPGFRSGSAWNKTVAVLGYLFIFLLSLGIETNSGMPLFLILDRISVAAAALFIVAMVTDYGGISRHIPLIGDSSVWRRIIGYIIFGFLGVVFAALWPEILKNCMGM